MLTPRSVIVPVLTAALLAPGSAAVATPTSPAEGMPVQVTAVVQTADGRLSFVTERATSRARGLALASRLRARPGVLVSPEVRVDVRQAVTLTARRSGGTVAVDARVAPAGRTAVVLQVLRGTGWVPLARATTTTSGTVRFVKAVPSGTRVRVLAGARPALLAGASAARGV